MPLQLSAVLPPPPITSPATPGRLPAVDDAAWLRAVASLLAQALPGWGATATAMADGGGGLTVIQLTGGITNQLYKCADSAADPPIVLVRLFGANTELLISREAEAAVLDFMGSEAVAIGARCYAAFGNGRVEQWIPARALEPPEMTLGRQDVAAAAAADTATGATAGAVTGTAAAAAGAGAHACEAADEDIGVPGLIAERVADVHGLRFTCPDVGIVEGVSGLWKKLEGWCALVESLAPSRHPAGCLTHTELRRELTWLQARLAPPAGAASTAPAAAAATTTTAAASATALAHRFMHAIVFSHNDLLSGNVLVPAELPPLRDAAGAVVTAVATVTMTASRVGAVAPGGPRSLRREDVRLIDYEYAGYAPRAYDLANHWCEWAGFEFDFDAWYPRRHSEKHKWLRRYVARWLVNQRCARAGAAAVCTATPAPLVVDDDADVAAIAAIVDATPSDEAAAGSEDFWRAAGDVVDGFALASHYWWGIWAILQAVHSPIDFDFAGYSRKRFAFYAEHKAVFGGGGGSG